MIRLTDKELKSIDGGSNWFTAAFFNAAARAINTLLDMGRSLGTAIRRTINGSYCPL